MAKKVPRQQTGLWQNGEKMGSEEPIQWVRTDLALGTMFFPEFWSLVGTEALQVPKLCLLKCI